MNPGLLGALLAVILALLAASVTLAVLWRRERAAPHTCLMVPIAAAPAPAPVFTTKTAILWRCRYCDEVDATSIDGVWAMGQIAAWGPGPMPPGWAPGAAAWPAEEVPAGE